MATKFLIFFTLLSFLSISSSLSTETIPDAAATLTNSGFNSMALILEFGSQTLIPPTTSLTIFCPSDTAFTESGQPSLSLLRFHFSPQTFRFNTLKSLPPGTKIPTLFSNHSLIITSTPSCEDQVSLNGVKINESAIYSNGSFVIFGIHKFLDPDFEVSGLISGRPVSSLDCSVLDNNSDYSLKEAIRVLRSKEYSILAMFLDLQLGEFNDEMMVTIFAPVDEVMKGYISKFREYRSIFLRHFVPCKISINDLVNFDNGVVLPSYLEGFMINVTKSGYSVMLNGVQVTAPGLYYNNWLEVHGLEDSFLVQEETEHSSTESKSNDCEKIVAPDFIFIIGFSFLFLCIF